MQKVFRRTTYVQKQALRRARKAENLRKWTEKKVQLREREPVEKAKKQLIRDALRQQQEDWRLGGLAPRRDVGDNTLTYGTIDSRIMYGRDVPKKDRVKYWNLAKGDRIAILSGPDKGKIGSITVIDKEKQNVTVKGLNMYEVAIPEFMRKNNPNLSAIQAVERPLRYDDVRLVHRYEDPETGTSRDVIVRAITPEIYEDLETDKTRWHRKVSGMEHIEIPWPDIEEDEKHVDHDEDTLRLDTEERTWLPTLLEPPIPTGVIDELRHKYSSFRDRHDPEYISEHLDKMDREEEIKKATKAIEDPIFGGRKPNPKKKKLTDNQWLRLGQAMIKNLSVEDVHARLQKYDTTYGTTTDYLANL